MAAERRPSKRPPNAYLLFCKEHAREFQSREQPDSQRQLARRAGEAWKRLPPDAKARYYEKAKQLLDEYKQTHANTGYKKKHERGKPPATVDELLEQLVAGMPYGVEEVSSFLREAERKLHFQRRLP
jgi:acyl-CoA reductase-like NAD-dependent aldehyde dehydrogenase